MSAYPQIEFGIPESTQRGLLDRGTSYLLPVEFEHGFEGFDVNFEIGRWLRPAQHVATWIAGVVVTTEVSKGFELLAELHEETAVHQSQDNLVLNFGTRFDLSDRYTLLMSAGRDLHNSLGTRNTLLTYFGLQLRY
jgi:hypothetical protein